MPRDEIPGLRAAQLRLGRLPGYVRRPDLARRSSADGHTYKKGWEVRFTARTEAEITEIRDLVIAAGFAPARPFFKGHQLIQPVYGIAAVQAYLAAREAFEELTRARAAGTDATGAATSGTPLDRARTLPIPEQVYREAAAPVAAAAAAAAAAGAAALAANSAGTVAPAGAAPAGASVRELSGVPVTAGPRAGAHGRRPAASGVSAGGRTS
ncbi:hypothetical protein [Streptomyces sp. NRRL B-24484]|uniref:hypothetical protein n=1 Tax=Streptomyces sp. NRRL B-24484 TaxID=1463833 RepID=UPI0004C181BE|nr:hypothetical protein [Streptomyces sp. NRRL B-24484]